MKRALVVMILSVLGVLLLLSGCRVLRNEMPSEVDFKKGIAELKVGTLPGTPPATVYPNARFTMVAELDNQAAYEVTDGEITIVGLDPYYIEMSPLEQDFNPLEGRSVTSPAGIREFKEFQGIVHKTDGSLQYDARFYIQARYLSTVEFSDTVCLNPSLYNVYDGGCSVKGKTTYRGQGAPVAVAAMEEIVSPGNDAGVEFRLLLQNKGSGKVEFVHLQNAKLGNVDVSCEFVGAEGDPRTLRLDPQTEEGILICKAPLRSLYSYTTTMSAMFTYGYEVQVPQKVTVINPTVR